MNKNKKKGGRLRLINLDRDGKGVSKSAADQKPGLKKFFITFGNHFNKLVSVNIFFILGNFPFIFLIANLSGYLKAEYSAPFSDLFQNIGGIFAADGGITPYKLTLYSLDGIQQQAFAYTTANYIFLGIGALGLLTFGLVNVGTAYIVRNMVKGEPIFVWTDFWYSFKRNYRQAMIFGAIDFLITALLVWNLASLITSPSQFFLSMLFWSNVALFIVYFFMRYYMYVQMVTFKLSIYKMIKNSLIFAILGFKRNIMAFLGIIALLILEFLLIFSFGGILLPFAVAAPLAILPAAMSYMKVYAAYPKIKQYMIDPYYEEHPEELPQMPDDEPIMTDDVTEKERLEAIKKKNSIG